jgi:PAS domain S-box-containing protein
MPSNPQGRHDADPARLEPTSDGKCDSLAWVAPALPGALDAAGIGVLVLDHDGALRTVCRTAAKILGPDPAVRADLKHLCAELEQPNAGASVERVLIRTGPAAQHLHCVATHARGGPDWARYFVLVNDETGRHRTEERARGSIARLASFLDSSPALTFLKDEEGRYAYMNRAYSSFFGWELSDVIGKTDFELRDREIAERLRASDRATLAADRAMHTIEEVPDAAGERHHWLIVKFPFHDESGRTYVAGHAINVTAQHRAEEASRKLNLELEQTVDELKSLLDVLPVAIGIARDPECRKIQTNRAFAAMLGLPPGANASKTAPRNEVPGNYRVFYKGAELEPHELPMQLAATGETIQEAEQRVVRSDGHVLDVLAYAAPLRGRDGVIRGSVGAFVDVSERKRLEAELTHANKMESIGRLAGGVAHDFNNLLTAIFGFSDMIDGVLDDQSPARTYLLGLRSAADHAAALTRQLLAFARKQKSTPKVIDAHALLREQQVVLQRLVGERVELRLETRAAHPNIMVDPYQFQQVLVNLAANARDVMPAGGELCISTSDVDLPPSEVPGTSDLAPGPHLCITVSDTGPGIPEHIRPRLFEPFFTTKPIGRGTGLGLATCYGLIRQNHGSIEVDSPPGRGAEFRILFRRDSGQPAPAEPRAANEPAGGHETVLLAEDEPLVAEVMTRTLKSLGYNVLPARNGAEALQIAGSHEGRIHLLLSDMVMPQMSGPELAEKLATVRPDTKIVFMSGYPNEARARARRLPGPLLAKPFALRELTRLLRDVLDSPPEGTATPATPSRKSRSA